MMLRYRRYRVFVVFAIFAVFGFYYHFASNSEWSPAAAISVGSLKNIGVLQSTTKSESQDQNAQLAKEVEKSDEREADLQAPLVKEPPIRTTQATLLDVVPVAKLTGTRVQAGKTSSHVRTAVIATATPADDTPLDTILADHGVEEGGQGRLDMTATVSRSSAIHWSPQSEHFPISSTIQLPTGKPSTIPRIQHDFEKETTAQKEERLEKLKVIRDTAAFSWQGYKDKAVSYTHLTLPTKRIV